MIVERHYDDETLIGLLGSRQEAVRDPHLVSCAPCAEALSSYRSIVDVLGADAIWDLRELRLEPQPETIETLRRTAGMKVAEEQRATFLVAELLSLPRAAWLSAARTDIRMHSLGLVERLVEVSETLLTSAPPDAIEVVRAAMEIASIISTEEYPSDSVVKARAIARRQYAYSLFYTGEFNKALEFVEQAEAMLGGCMVADYDLARLGIVRALIHTSQENYEAAFAAARQSAQIFRSYADRQRLASALIAEAHALIYQFRYTEALPTLLEVEESYRDDIDSDTRARVLTNIALCQWQTGKIATALQSYQVAAAISDEIGAKAESARIRYNVAGLLAAQGRRRDAEIRLRSVREEFQRLGMHHMATYAGLDLAEILLLDRNHVEVERLCREALRQFVATGLSETSEKALTALTYLQEAAEQRRATPEAVRHVREYIGRLPSEPRLLFAPPPLPPI